MSGSGRETRRLASSQVQLGVPNQSLNLSEAFQHLPADEVGAGEAGDGVEDGVVLFAVLLVSGDEVALRVDVADEVAVGEDVISPERVAAASAAQAIE